MQAGDQENEDEDADADHDTLWKEVSAHSRRVAFDPNQVWVEIKKAVIKTIDVEHYDTPLQSLWKTAIIDLVARHSVCV